MIVDNISWNLYASILALVCRKDSSGPQHNVLLLFVKSNYKYFMKKKVDLRDGDILQPQWISDRYPTIFIINKTGYY